MTAARGRAFAAAAFLGSFLTFSLELASAKLVLPRFGGSAEVWTSSVMFFSGLLALGYGLAHAALRRWGPRACARAQLLLLAVPFASFPLRLPAPAGLPPLAELLRALAVCVGAPFLVLSTTVPLLSRRLGAGDEGYALFGASNAGALAALAAYPLAVEPLLSLRAQSLLFAALYAAYAALHLVFPPVPDAPPAVEPAAAPSAGTRALWLLLSAAPCAAMLATTNLLTLDFAAVPLLWTVPLAVYLATFVLNFKAAPWYPDRLNSALLPVLGGWTALCLALAALTVLRAGDSTPVQTLRRLLDVGKFGYVTAALFVVGMICHRSLAAARPRSESAMSEYWLWIAVGGWAGSVCVGVLVPALGRASGGLALDWAAAGGLAGAALILRDRDALAGLPRTVKVLLAVSAAGALGVVLAAAAVRADGVVFRLRNFYGVYSVVDKDGVRELFHGNTDHGSQSLDPARRGEPLSYYNLHSPLAEALEAFGPRARTIGVVGLGGGAIAAYGRPGQDMDFYELDPDVATLADRWFTYLRDSRARVRVIPGDARLSLEANSGARYDVLILDAFNSGAVPVHLLTKEALSLYLGRLAPGGVILLHVSNRYLDLRPMLAASARDLGLSGAAKRTAQRGRIAEDRVPSSWAALTRDPARAETLTKESGWAPLSASESGASAWTDQHASLLPVLAF